MGSKQSRALGGTGGGAMDQQVLEDRTPPTRKMNGVGVETQQG